MELMYATCSLSLTTAKKLAGLHTNGDVEEAMTAADSAKEAYVDFVRDEAAGISARSDGDPCRPGAAVHIHKCGKGADIWK